MTCSRPRGTIAAVLATSALPAGFYTACVAPRIRTWGTTRTERRRAWPGDDLVPRPGFVWTNAVTIERPPSEVWPWVTQLGQGRAGLYSYDWLENLMLADVHSCDTVLPEHQGHLAVGERVVRMTRYAPPNPIAAYHPGQGPVQFVMQRKMMLGIKQRAEGVRATGVADVLVPCSWFAVAAVTAVHARRLVAARPAGDVYVLVTGLSAVAVQVLLFFDLPAAARAAMTSVLVA